MNEVLDQVFGGSDYAEPATWYLGLATGVAANGTITGEPSGNNYSRVSITNDKDAWTDAAAGALANEVDFTFPQASGSWGAMDTFFLSNTSTGGTALCYGPLAVEKTPLTGDTPKFSAGDLDIQLTDTP
jgi:hypothetical protein